MQSIVTDAIGGINAFVAAQRRAAGELGEARLSLALFDDQYEVPLKSIALADVPDLTLICLLPSIWPGT